MKQKIDQLSRLISSSEFKDVMNQRDFITNEPMTSLNYYQQLQNKLSHLKRVAEEEQQKLDIELDNQDQIKQELAECIRQSHINTGIISQEVINKKNSQAHESLKLTIQLKQQELRHLENAVAQLEDEVKGTFSINFNTKQDLERMGAELNQFQVEAQEVKQEHTEALQEVQTLNQTKHHLTQALGQQKVVYQQAKQRLRATNAKLAELEAQSDLCHSETQKFEQEIAKIKPKLEIKLGKLQELDDLKLKVFEALQEKNEELAENRRILTKLEEEFKQIPDLDKLIATEKKAEKALNTERKLLMTEFQRVSSHSGIEQLSKKMSNASHMQESFSDEKLNSQQQVIQNQQEAMQMCKDELQYIADEQHKLVARKEAILTDYSVFQTQMEELGAKYKQLNQKINQ